MFRWAHSVVLLEALLDNARGLEFIKYNTSMPTVR